MQIHVSNHRPSVFIPMKILFWRETPSTVLFFPILYLACHRRAVLHININDLILHINFFFFCYSVGSNVQYFMSKQRVHILNVNNTTLLFEV